MKERTPEQLKGQIRSFAGKRNLQSQESECNSIYLDAKNHQLVH